MNVIKLNHWHAQHQFASMSQIFNLKLNIMESFKIYKQFKDVRKKKFGIKFEMNAFLLTA